MGIVSRSQGGSASSVAFSQTLGADSGAGIDSGAGGFGGAGNLCLIVVQARTDEAVGLSTFQVILNSDSTAANYDVNRLSATNTVVTAANSPGAVPALFCAGNTAAATNFGLAVIAIPAYQAAVPQKSMYLLNGVADPTAANQHVGVRIANWHNVGPVTRVKIIQAGGTVLRAGSSMSVLTF